ncbi:phosphate ABC transporter substrate-binding protein PstS [Cryptosporangium aurantiacum]|uniref:Phosphate-binding protein n=1 Tax=Cryptosporangium aurantiacum TaxID=134849 RepID=A0A1M7RHQ0_9ACTN|nr:phosphate ABC transporter substrate-binding protein PstS [Cryptosporangium aurantiacum]SHN45691.1 phosphate ABC transporter substrate-binding protein, PhoT family [Cryptosporangium aurantiacum]
MKLHRTGAIAGIALASLLAISACGSDNTETASSDGSASSNPNCAEGQISASGSSAQKTAMNAWTTAYAKDCGAQINYSPTGSGAGVKEFTAGKVAFAGSDSALKDDEQTAADARCKTGKAINIPGVATAVAIVFNVNGVDKLTLDPATISKIFQGQIKTWNDPAIAKTNSGVTLPSTAISIVFRSKDSGTTDNFTKFLEAQTPETWKLGTGKGWKGTVGTGAPDSAGVVSAVTGKDGSISYVDAPDAKKNSLKAAALDTGAGAVEISDETVGKAIAAAEQDFDGNNLKLKLNYGLKEAGAYPAVLVTYQITCEKGLTADEVKLTKGFLSYVVSDAGQTAAADAGYSKLPADLLTKAQTAAAAIA